MLRLLQMSEIFLLLCQESGELARRIPKAAIMWTLCLVESVAG
jgi:hypothetical protein